MLEYEAERRRRGAVNVVKEGPPLAEHLQAFERHLSGKSDSHVQHTLSRVRAFGFVTVAELVDGSASDKVLSYLRGLQTKPNKENGDTSPVTDQTKNHYLTAIKMFCRYLARFRNVPPSPILNLAKFRAESKRKRRALNDAEVKRLLGSVKGEVQGLTASQRRHLYFCALNTGFRAKELAALETPADFAFSATRPTINLAGRFTKNHKPVEQPVAPAVATTLGTWLKTQRAAGKPWPGNWYQRGAEMLEVDLKAAKIPVTTDAGTVDFHALRVTFVTNLVRAGLHPKVVQTLARHASIELTMKLYAKLESEDLFCSIGAVKICPLPPSSDSPVSNGSHKNTEKNAKSK